MSVKIQIKRANASAWTAANPTLAAGEWGMELDTKKLKLGTGALWNSTDYYSETLTLNSVGDVTITSLQNGDFLRYSSSASAWINDPVNLSTDTVGDYVQSLTAGTGVTLSNNSGEGATPTVAIGQVVGTSASVTFGQLTVNGQTNVGGNIIPNTNEAYDLGSASARFRDIYLSGTTINLGGAEITSDGTNISFSGGIGVSGSANFVGDLTGNADTATTLETSREISLAGDLSGSASFDGSTNVTITATVQPNSVALGTDTTGNYVNDVVSGTGVTVTHAPGEGSSASIAIGQDVATSASVQFAKVTASLDGNASTASTLQTPRTIALTGDVSGSVSFNGASDVSISATVQPNSVALGTDTTGNFVNDVTAGTGVTVTHTPGEGSSPTIAIGQAVGTSSSVQFAAVTAPLTGNVTGNADTATALQTARVIALSGDVSGSVSFNGTGNVDISTTIGANSVSLGSDTSGDYVSSLVAGTGVSLANNSGETATPTISIGQDVATSASVTFAKVDTTGDVTVGGNLTVNGTTTTLNTETLSVEDNIVVLNSNATGSPALNAGLEVERGDSANVVLRWNESTDKWETTNDGSAYSVIATNGNIALGTDTTGNYMSGVSASTGVTVEHAPGEGSSATISIGQSVAPSASVTFAAVSAPLIGNVTGDVSGNSGTATALQNSRVISIGGDVSGSVSFNGTSDVTISAAIQPNSVALGTDTTGNFVNDVTAGTGVSVTHTPGEGSSPTIAIGQAVSTSSSVTFGHVSAPVTGNVTGNLTGNADTAATLQTPRTISLSGDVSGSVSFNGSANVDISATVQPNSVALGTDTTGNYMSDLTQGTGVSITHTPGEGSNATIAIGQAVGTSSSVQFAAVTAPLIGNASTATTLENARTISLAGDVSGSVSFNGSSDVSISATIQPNSVALGTDTTGDYVSSLVAGTNISISNNSGEGATPTISVSGSVSGVDSISGIDFVQFDTSANITPVTGLLGWDSVNGTLNLGLSANKHIHIGEESLFRVRNTTGTTIGKGAALYASGVESSGRIQVTPYVADGTIPEVRFMGLASESIADGVNGFVQHFGHIRDLDTRGTSSTAISVGDETWAAGDILYVHPTVPGKLTNVAPRNAIVVALVIVRHQTTGWLFVRPSSGGHIEDIHDVVLTSPTDGQFLRYNSASTVWVNDTINLGTDTAGDYVQSLVAGTGVTLTNNSGETATPTVAIGQSVATSASVTFAHLVVQGDMEVQGTITRLNETNLDIDEAFIYLNANSASANPDMGVAFNYNDGTYRHAGLFRDASDGIFKVFEGYEPEPQTPINTSDATYSDARFQADSIILTQTTGTAPMSVSSSTVVTNLNADKLDGQDGSYYAPIDSPTFTGTVSLPNNTVALGTQTTGNYVADVSGGTGVTITHTPGEGTTPSVAIGQDVATSASVTFAAVTAPVVGNASTASTLQTPRTISLSGDVSGSVSFNGSANVDITATVQPNSVALGTDTTGNYVNDLTAGTGVTVTHTPGEGSSPTVAIGQAVGTSSSVQFAAVTAPLIGNVTGNADTATALATSRTIELTGDVTGSVSFNGSANASIAATIQPNSVALGTDTTGNYVNDLTGGTGVTITHTPGEGSSPTVAIGQSVATSASVTFAHVAADVTGNVTGNITGSSGSTTGNAATATALQSARNISLTGDVSGSVSFNGTSDVSISATIQPNSVALGTDTTGNYMSDVSAANGLTVTHTPGEGSSASFGVNNAVLTNYLLDGASGNSYGLIGTSEYLDVKNTNGYNKEIELDIVSLETKLTTDGYLKDSSTSASVSFAQVSTTGNVTVGGNLTVNGTTTTLNTETLAIEDNIVVLNSNVTGSPTTNAGIEVERGTSSNVSVRWNETTDKWELTQDGSTYLQIATASDVSAVTIASLDDIADVSASTAAAGDFLKWNGAAWVNDPINLGTDTTGNYLLDVVAGTGLTVSHTPGEGSSASVALNATLDDLSNVNVSAPTDGYFLKYVSASSAWVPAEAVAAPTTTSVSASTPVVVDSFNKTTHRSAEFTIQVTQGSLYTSLKALVLHDGTTAKLVQYGIITFGETPIPLTVSSDISGSNVRLSVTITDAATTGATIKVLKSTITT